MSIGREVDFTDGVTVVTAAFLNLIQEMLAGIVTNVTVERTSSTQVSIPASSDEGAAVVYLGGEFRRRDTTVSHTFTGEGSGTYNVYVTADTADDLFAIEVASGASGATLSRKVGEVDWNGSSITAVRNTVGVPVKAHSHLTTDATGELDHADLLNLTTGDPHTQYLLGSAHTKAAHDALGIDAATLGGASPSAYVTDAELAASNPLNVVSLVTAGAADINGQLTVTRSAGVSASFVNDSGGQAWEMQSQSDGDFAIREAGQNRLSFFKLGGCSFWDGNGVLITTFNESNNRITVDSDVYPIYDTARSGWMISHQQGAGRTIFYQGGTPASARVGDLWIDTTP